MSQNTVYTLTFINSQDIEDATPTIWVFQNREAYEQALKQLSTLWHIKILQSGQSNFVSAKENIDSLIKELETT